MENLKRVRLWFLRLCGSIITGEKIIFRLNALIKKKTGKDVSVMLRDVAVCYVREKKSMDIAFSLYYGDCYYLVFIDREDMAVERAEAEDRLTHFAYIPELAECTEFNLYLEKASLVVKCQNGRLKAWKKRY